MKTWDTHFPSTCWWDGTNTQDMEIISGLSIDGTHVTSCGGSIDRYTLCDCLLGGCLHPVHIEATASSCHGWMLIFKPLNRCDSRQADYVCSSIHITHVWRFYFHKYWWQCSTIILSNTTWWFLGHSEL